MVHRKSRAYKALWGLENIDKVIEIDQKPIGRMFRSNPATHVKSLITSAACLWDYGIEDARLQANVFPLYEGTPEACSGDG